MTPTKQELLDMIRMTADVIAGRLFNALPDDPDCQAAFDAWRKVQQELFAFNDPAPWQLYEREQAAFKTLMAELAVAGVEKF